MNLMWSAYGVYVFFFLGVLLLATLPMEEWSPLKAGILTIGALLALALMAGAML